MEYICDSCGHTFEILRRSYERTKKGNDGLYICRSCSAIRRSSNPEYLAKIGRKGKAHWAFGLKGERSPNFGNGFSDERKRHISEAKMRLTPSGVTIAQEATRKAVATMRRNGSYRTMVAKSAVTKEKNQSWVVYKTKRYKGFYYRSSLEKRFLEEQEQCGQLSNLTNCGFSILYHWKGGEHHYIPDYFDKVKGILYEIKSGWTWDGKGKRPELKAINKRKLAAAKEAGYETILVIYRQGRNGKYQGPEIYNHEQIRSL